MFRNLSRLQNLLVASVENSVFTYNVCDIQAYHNMQYILNEGIIILRTLASIYLAIFQKYHIYTKNYFR